MQSLRRHVFSAQTRLLGGSGSSGLTVSTTLTTSGGVYAITVIGTGPSGMTHSVTVDLTVNAANFKISATPPTPVAPGGTAMSTVTLTSFDSYAFPVNLSCSVAGTGSPLPACSVTGTTPLTPTSGGATSTVTITTTAPGAAMIRPRKFFYALWLPVVGLSLLGFGFKTSRSHRKKLLGFLLLGIVMTGLILLPSCGGSSQQRRRRRWRILRGRAECSDRPRGVVDNYDRHYVDVDRGNRWRQLQRNRLHHL